MKSLYVAFAALMIAMGCQNSPPREIRVYAGVKSEPLKPTRFEGYTQIGATFSDLARLKYVRLPESTTLGKSAEIELVFEVLKASESFPKVFVHAQVPGAKLTQLGADHEIKGASPENWLPGDLVVDVFELKMPANWYAESLELYVGLYTKNERFKVKESSKHDGKHRVYLSRFKVFGDTHEQELVAAFAEVAPKIDGILDDAIWAKAKKSAAFVSYDGRRAIKNSTHAQLAYDDKNLYLAFLCKDDDIHTPYRKRDDPLYESEAVEIFIDADGDKDQYVELQAAPNGQRFDASFKGGPRKNFNTSYDVNTEVAVALDGTINDNSDKDRGFISEWRIPISELPDAKTPKAGDRWRINLFRLDRRRRGAKVVSSEASAWQTPLSGDFHNLERFGTLRFER